MNIHNRRVFMEQLPGPGLLAGIMPNNLDRFSLGTKNQNLTYADDGSLTLTVGGERPTDPGELANWLPAPDDDFSVYLRAYWPGERILNGDWAPPAVEPA